VVRGDPPALGPVTTLDLRENFLVVLGATPNPPPKNALRVTFADSAFWLTPPTSWAHLEVNGRFLFPSSAPRPLFDADVIRFGPEHARVVLRFHAPASSASTDGCA
jgi:hypothetical protein